MSILNNKYSIEVIDSWNMTIDKIQCFSNNKIPFYLNLMNGYVIRISKVNKIKTSN